MKRLTIHQLPLFVHALLGIIFILSLGVLALPLVGRFRPPATSPVNVAAPNQEFDTLLRELEASKDTIKSLLQ